ncbi:hypothetical protein [Streptomyces sp. KN37]|uniref:hypothetical protein n=1 Tax=Streptomyces sp. KN37 TaxID=3090667 RepID=UPI002A76536C|nr:hypothetical protein [Streptomyces sp. KN37]WPO69163.1 hypothetical protein R9806_00175 [Streptomyces sp. KN37]
MRVQREDHPARSPVRPAPPREFDDGLWAVEAGQVDGEFAAFGFGEGEDAGAGEGIDRGGGVVVADGEFGAVGQRLDQFGGRCAILLPGQCGVQDLRRLLIVALGVAEHDGVLQRPGQLADRGRTGAASTGDRKIRVQLPPGSMTVNPDWLSAFLRFRGRVIRGIPETRSLPWTARMPAANASKSCCGSGTMTTQPP